MTEDPYTVSPKMKINHVASLMKERNVGSLVVTKKNVPVGVITESDIIRKAVAENFKPSQTTVKDIMTNPIATVSPDTDITVAAKIMNREHHRIMAVIENSELIGIITQRDIIRLSPALLEISREYAKINGDTAKSYSGPIEGICENCREFSQDLTEINGLFICPFCCED
jgi:signal-transduction protein with cAMP-binding, CBS, and nucleotidyltransferase domain